MQEQIEKWIKESESKIEEAQLNFKSCIDQGMSDGILNDIWTGIQRETGKLNAYKGCYVLTNFYDAKSIEKHIENEIERIEKEIDEGGDYRYLFAQ